VATAEDHHAKTAAWMKVNVGIKAVDND